MTNYEDGMIANFGDSDYDDEFYVSIETEFGKLYCSSNWASFEES